MQKYLYEIIVKDILEKINTGVYKPGDKLPTEKELATTHNVSVITSKRAFDFLSDHGYITKTRGKGTYVSIDENAISPVGPIGIVVDGISESFGLEFIKELELLLMKNNIKFFWRNSWGDVKLEERILKEFLELNVKKIVLIPVDAENYSPTLLKLVVDEFPLICVDRKLKHLDINFISTDHYAAAYKMTEYLIDTGIKNIAFVLPHKSRSSLLERENGFKDACKDHFGKDSNPISFEVTPGIFTYENDLEAEIAKDEIIEFIELNKDVDCFFAAQYNIAELIYECLQQLKIDKKIVTFDCKYDIFSSFKFAHMKQNEKKIATEVFKTISEKSFEIKNIRIESKLVTPDD